MELGQIRFAKTHNEEFYKVLRKRVNSYFKDNNVSRYANFSMVMKTIAMISMYYVPFILILTVAESTWFTLLMWSIMGAGMAGIGLSIMHDANHNAYSKNKWVNKILGKMLNAMGGSDLNWRIQHNVLHHTYTNISGMDEDIDIGNLMRFSPNQRLMKGHRFQHIYAWFLYGLMTVMWIFTKDYRQFARYQKRGLLKTQTENTGWALTQLILSKVLYIGLIIVLPIVLNPSMWWPSRLSSKVAPMIPKFNVSCVSIASPSTRCFLVFKFVIS